MRLTEILERDRESLLAALKSAGSCGRAAQILNEACSRLLVQYNESCESAAVRESAAYMMRALQSAVPLLDTVGETKVWERNSSPEAGKRSGRRSRWHIVLLFLGMVSLVAGVVFTALSVGKLFPVKLLPWIGGFLLFSLICIYAAGRNGRKVPVLSKEQQVEVLPDAERIYRLFHAAVVSMDQDLAEMERREKYDQRQRIAEKAQSSDPAEWDLYAGLLEAAESGDGEYALDQLRNVRHYLHRRGVELVEYSDQTREWFDVMPSQEDGTLRPALVCDGKVLKRGLAGLKTH